MLHASTIGSFDELLVSKSKRRLKCITQNNRSTLVDINSNQPLYHSFTVSVNICGGNCNTIDGPYAWTCVWTWNYRKIGNLI